MDTKCPYCGTEYKVGENEIGLVVTCQVCGKRFVVESVAQKPEVKEKVIIRAKPSLRAAVFMSAVFVGLGSILGSLFLSAVVGCPEWAGVMGVGMFVGLSLACIGPLLVGKVVYGRTEYIITNKRVIVQEGLMTKTSRQVQVADMRDIFLRRGPFQRLAGLGTISIGSQTTGLMARIRIFDVEEYQWIVDTLESLRTS